MHIAVCVKQVPDTSQVRIDPETNTLVREGVPSIMNPLDAFAVEGAVRLREELGGRVTALSMGPPQAEAVVREAIAHGCDDGILLSDPAFAGSDTWATSYTLAHAVRRLDDVKLVLCGKQAIDGDTAQVGPGLAVHLGWSQATYVRDIQEADERKLTAECLTDRGIEVLQVKLPAVMTALKDLNEPRLPSLVSQMRARRCEIEAWGLNELGDDEKQFGLNGSPTRVIRVFSPPPRGEARIWDGEPAHAARELAAALDGEGLL